MESMFVRCEDCNYENLVQHSFCGMCGAKLPSPRRGPSPTAVAEPGPSGEPAPVSVPQLAPNQRQTMRGPSLLGLSAETAPPDRVSYLLEDEPGNTNWRPWAAVLVLAVVLGGAGWYWRADIHGLAVQGKNSAVDTTPAPQTAAVETAPASPAAQPATQAPVPEGPASGTPPPAGVPSEQAATHPAQAMTDAVARVPEAKEEQPSMSAASPATIQPTASAIVPPPAKPKIERKAPVPDASAEALEAQGENYLYGHGVQADCGLAGKNLLAAAHSSLKAQTVLGTMYATGHCVPRDLPVAYRWFAKASHQDPTSLRLQRDLEVLWQQMTPEEREIATKSGP